MKNKLVRAILLFALVSSLPVYAREKKGGHMHPNDFLHKEAVAAGSTVGEGEIAIRWFGTAAYRIEYRNAVLWIDPFFSRQGLLTLARTPLEPRPAEIDRYMDRADYIVLGHSHYDHAADLPYIVPRTKATVVGSVSTANLLRAHKVPDSQIRVVKGGDTVELGPYKISFIHSVHGKIFGRIPSNFDIPADAKPPLKAGQYGCGEVFGLLIEVGGKKIYHQGSAGIVDEPLESVRADIVLLGISSRFATPNFVYRIVKKVQPQVLIPMHYDYFFRPLSRGFMMIPRMKFGDVVAQAREAKPDIKIVTLPLLGEYRVFAK